MTRHERSHWLALAVAIGCCRCGGDDTHRSDGGSEASASNTSGTGADAMTADASNADGAGAGADASASSDASTEAAIPDSTSPDGSSADAASAEGANPDASRGGAPLLRVSSNKRYLVDPSDHPFYLVGDSAWCLLPGLTVSEANTYFKTRASEGFNAVLMDADVQLGASPVGAPERGPADANGNKPFNGTLSGGAFDVSTVPAQGDTTSTAGKYWANVDAIIAAAAQNGIEIIFDVYDNYNPWFGSGSSPNSTAQLKSYGQFLGQRYVGFDNIIWMLGNDYNESSTGDANLAAVVQGSANSTRGTSAGPSTSTAPRSTTRACDPILRSTPSTSTAPGHGAPCTWRNTIAPTSGRSSTSNPATKTTRPSE